MKILKYWPLPVLILVTYGLWFSWRQNSDLKKIVNLILPSKIQLSIKNSPPAVEEQTGPAKTHHASVTNKKLNKNIKTFAKNTHPLKKKSSHSAARGIASVPQKNNISENKMSINSKKRVVIE